MHRQRLFLVLGFALAFGVSLASGQDGTSVFGNQSPDRPTPHAKSKNNSIHRKHWWSPRLPHWFHKKNDVARARKNSNRHLAKNATGATPAKTRPATAAKAAVKPSRQKKTVATGTGAHNNVSSNTDVPGAHTPGMTAASKEPARKGVSQAAQSKKTTAKASGKKTARNDCSPDLTKKGGCEIHPDFSQAQ